MARQEDFDAMARACIRWQQRVTELHLELHAANERIAYLEGAMIGLISSREMAVDVESILSGGPGKRQVGP